MIAKNRPCRKPRRDLRLGSPLDAEELLDELRRTAQAMGMPVRSVEVECLPKDLPEIIRVDVSDLGLGAALHVSGLPALPGVKYLADGDVTVFLVSEPKVSDESATPAEGAASEPEVINEKKPAEGEAEAKKE